MRKVNWMHRLKGSCKKCESCRFAVPHNPSFIISFVVNCIDTYQAHVWTPQLVLFEPRTKVKDKIFLYILFVVC